jgi:hypothetical protein
MMTQLNLLDREWVNDSIPVVMTTMKGREFCADDLHSMLGEPENVNLYGILFAKLRPMLFHVGYKKSERPERNGGLVRVWKLKP